MRRLAIALAVIAALGGVVATVDAGAAGPRARAIKVRLRAFHSCRRLIHYARGHAAREMRAGGGIVPPTGAPLSNDSRGGQGAPGSTAGPEANTPQPSDGSDSSGTNVQEAGVDEPDIVKTDGKHIFALAGGRLNAVDARAATPKLLGSLALEGYGGDLLLRGKRALVISYAPQPVELPPPQAAQAAPDIAYPVRVATLISEIDVSDPAEMRIVRTETVDGGY